MLSRINLLWLGILAILVSRLAIMALAPLMDTSEPRYAEIARIMFETGDWITPYFNYGEPFWGKPPLAFWATALSFKLLGVNEFAARLPALIISLMLMALLYSLARRLLAVHLMPLPLLIYAGMALSFIAAGAVLTDPFLAFGMMLSLTAFYRLAVDQEPCRHSYWSELFFIGLAVGLLAKGPIALVLTLGPVTLWIVLQCNLRTVLSRFRWGRGLALMTLLSLPWYIAAEVKSPGFIDYFIVGEHFRRFLEPGWSGDLYGSAHIRPLGTIWLHALLATFPWSLVLLTMIAGKRLRKTGAVLRDRRYSYLLLWLLFPLLFFSLARNILWTYVLPALPAFSLLLAVYLGKLDSRNVLAQSRTQLAAALLVPLLLLGYTGYTQFNTQRLKTERELIATYRGLANPDEQLFYVESRPFSARFYSHGQAVLLSLADLKAQLMAGSQPGQAINRYFAIPHGLEDKLDFQPQGRLERVFSNRRFGLYRLDDS